MIRIDKTIRIDASPETVFRYLSDVARQPDWLPSLSEVHDIEGDGLGTTWRWVYTMMGIKLRGSSEIVESERDARLVIRSGGAIASTWQHTMTPDGDGTRYALTVSYEVPSAVGGRLAERLLRGQNDREAEQAVQNIKQQVEATAS